MMDGVGGQRTVLIFAPPLRRASLSAISSSGSAAGFLIRFERKGDYWIGAGECFTIDSYRWVMNGKGCDEMLHAHTARILKPRGRQTAKLLRGYHSTRKFAKTKLLSLSLSS